MEIPGHEPTDPSGSTLPFGLREPLLGLREDLLAGTENCPPDVLALADAVTAAVATPVPGHLATASGLTDRVTVLARLRAVLDAEVGRSLLAADSHQALPHTPVTHLQRSAAWSGSAASAVLVAARFTDRHPCLAEQWRTGRVNTDIIATIARGLRGLPQSVESDFVKGVLVQLPHLSAKGVRVLLSRALDLLHPDDRDAAEQSEWDRRTLIYSQHGSMTMLSADLPGLEGEAVTAALDALAESLRVEGDGLSAGQRRADALITLVNSAATHGDVPATRGGLPVATTITVGISQADRVATGAPQDPVGDLSEPTSETADPAAMATTQGQPVTLGDAAMRFALCAGTLTAVVVDDTSRRNRPISQVLAQTTVQPLAVGRATRLATPAQRTALALRDGGCILCGRAAAECQTHHVTAWSDGGGTDLANMVLLCWAHHRQVDLNRWTIERSPDSRPGLPQWVITPVPRHRWRRGTPIPHAA